MPRTWKSEKTNVGSAGLGCKARVRGHDSILGALLGAGWRRGSYRYARHHPPLPADICCLMAGGFYIDVNVAAGTPSEGHEIFQRAPDFTVAYVMLWSAEPMILIDARTVVPGYLFRMGPPVVRVRSEDN